MRKGTQAFLISGGNVSGAEKSKSGHFGNGKPAVSPEVRILFSGTETSRNGQFAKGNPAVSISGGNFKGAETSEKWSFRDR